MKNLLKLSLAVVLVTAFSCSSDDTPPVIPTVTFEHDRSIVEPGDEVTFTSTSMDADSYLWDFGDGNTSTDANPTHTYATTGSFTVRATVTSTTGDTAESTSTVVAGARWVTAFALVAIPDVNSEGKPWDDDGTGPELLFGYGPVGPDTPLFDIGDNFDTSTLPVTANVAPNSQVELTNAAWNFIYVDNDEPFDTLSAEEIMGGFEVNPVTQESTDKDFTTGIGTFTLSGGGFEVVIQFELRN